MLVFASDAHTCTSPLLCTFFLFSIMNLFFPQRCSLLSCLHIVSAPFLLFPCSIFMTSQDSRDDIYVELIETVTTFSHRTLAGTKVWLITFKCLLVNLRPLLTKQEHFWWFNLQRFIWARVGFFFLFCWRWHVELCGMEEWRLAGRVRSWSGIVLQII